MSNPINVPTPKTVTNAVGIPLDLLLAIDNLNARNYRGLARLFSKEAVMAMKPREVEILIRVASATDEAAIRPYYDEFRQLVIKMIGGAKRLADDITGFKLVQRTAKNQGCIEHSRSIGHIIKGDEFKSTGNPPLLSIRVLSCVRVARLALVFHRHELPFITDNGLPLDTELGGWTPREIDHMPQLRIFTTRQPEEFAFDEDDDDGDSYEGSDDEQDTPTMSAAAAAAAPVSVASAAQPAPQKTTVQMAYQHPYDRSPAKPRQTEAEYAARRDRMLGVSAARPLTVPVREFVPSPAAPTLTTTTTTTTKIANKHSAAPTTVAAASRVLARDDQPTSFDGAIADLLAVVATIDDDGERAIVARELDELITAAEAEIAARKPNYGILTTSINNLEASLEHAGPAEIESINARIASLKKAAARLARTVAK